MMSSSVYIIAGPNGAGKTTFAREFLPNYADCRNFVNADLIAQGMSPFSPESAAVRAGRLMLAESDFLANFFYLWVPSAELALSRIKERVLRGGHDVPEDVVRRRFEAFNQKLPGLLPGARGQMDSV
jgi:predicted ABC-type ATPase